LNPKRCSPACSPPSSALCPATSKLRDKFDVFFTDDACAWRLKLVPKQERVRAKVDGIEIAGNNGSIAEILLNLANGDRSVLTIREAE
jgi:hypothetical protein